MRDGRKFFEHATSVGGDVNGGDDDNGGNGAPEKPEPKPAPADLAQVGAGIAALVAVLSGLTFTGALERAARNEGEDLAVAFAVAALAGGLWFLAASAPAPQKWVLGFYATAFLVAGIAYSCFVVLGTYSRSEDPSISATVDEDLVLSTVVRTAGVRSDAKVGVRVEGFRTNPEYTAAMARNVARRPDPLPPRREQFVLYEVSLGPTPEGRVDHSVSLPIATGTYELIRIRATTAGAYDVCPLDRIDDGSPLSSQLSAGCLVLTLPRHARAPRVSAEWAATGGRAIVARVQTVNTPHRIAVHVVGRRRKKVATTLLAPDERGRIDASLRFPVPRGIRVVCVVARWHRRPYTRRHRHLPVPVCPPRISAGTGWVLVGAPG